MPLLTKKLGFPSYFPSIDEYQYGIGLFTDGQQSYFYCCSSPTLHYVRETASSAIFRLKISGQLYFSNNWEFVGKVDFLCQNNTISPCGKYFWSIEKKKPDRWQFIFRLVNIKTLEYEIFETTGFDPDTVTSLHRVRIHYTSNSGLFLILGRWLKDGIYSETGDVVFRLHVNKSQKRIRLEQLNFPNLPTVEPLAFCSYDPTCDKTFNYGIDEDSLSVFFYQIDYFGDLFVLEWSDKIGILEWIQFTVEGDQFEAWMSIEDREPRNNLNGWSYMGHKVLHNTRVCFENGYLCCTRSFNEDKRKTYFYHCDFNIETCVCRSKRIFSTYDSFCPVYNDVILSKNNGLEMLFLCTRYKYIFDCKKVVYWEKVILNGIPTLLNLTYLAVSQMIEKRKNTASLSIENAKSVTVPNVESNVINQQPTYKWSILEWFRRRLAKKKRETPSTINEPIEPRPRMVIELDSNICKEQDVTTFSIATYSQVNDLLSKLNKILV